MSLILFLFATTMMAERVECPVSGDTWVEMRRWESGGKPESPARHGRDRTLAAQGREAFILLQFDLSAAKGMTVSKATLRIWREANPVPFHTAGLSTISGNGPWTEASASFLQPAGAGAAWSYAGSDLADVTFAQGGSLYSYPRARDAGGGWWEVDVAPALVHAMLSSDQFGLMLTDEKGQTQTRHEFASRETGTPPVLVIEGSRGDRTAPGAVRVMGAPAAGERMGSVVLQFGGAGDDGGQGIAQRYDLRYGRGAISAASFDRATKAPRWMIDPLAPKLAWSDTSNALQDRLRAVVEGLDAGQTYFFAARAIDEAGNTGPVTALGSYRIRMTRTPALPASPEVPAQRVSALGARSETVKIWAVPELLKIDARTGALLEQSDFPQHRAANRVWDAARGSVRLKGARNEFVAFQLAVESAGPLSGIEVKVTRPLFAGSRLPKVFEATGAVQLYREWFVPDEQGWYADALIPLKGAFDLPAADNAVPGQTVQPVFADVYIPHDAAPGAHTGELTVRAGGREQRIKLELDVLPVRLPDKLNFVVDLNCYGGVGRGYGGIKDGTPEYRRLEHAYHRMAHLHRTNLDILGYRQDGNTVADHAPPLTGEGAETRIADWQDWDAHFGPLLDGSAFGDLPRAKVPVAAMYLPFFENWPGDLRRTYRFQNYPIAKSDEEYRAMVLDHAMNAAPVEDSFPPEYQARYSAVLAGFANHLKQRGWTNSQFFVYLNNKYYNKRPAQGGRGISWWLLDEPNHRDDVRAISFFADLTKKGVKDYPDVPIRFRTDISRVEWIRDLLADQVDLNCISRRFFEKTRMLSNDRRRFGKVFWNYASTNHPRETNVSMRAWCWRVWALGGDGLLPWNAVAGARAWERAEPLTVFYPGEKFGQIEPFASLRLKAYRRGQQDIEYLMLLAARKGWDREAVTRAVLGAVDLSGEVTERHEEDAGEIRFAKLKDGDFEQLRLRVARALTGAAR